MNKKEVKRTLSHKFQPQWDFRTYASARKELKFQKDMNPQTYNFLLKKDILVGGKRVSVKDVVKKRLITKKKLSSNPYEAQLKKMLGSW